MSPLGLNAAFIAIFTTILTASVTLLTTYLSNKANTQRMKMQLQHERLSVKQDQLHEKLEELYVTSKKWFLCIDGYFLIFKSALFGKSSMEEAEVSFLEHARKQDIDYQRLEMLLELYFPQLKEQFSHVLTANEELKGIVRQYKFQPEKTETDGSHYAGILGASFERFKSTKNSYLTDVANVTKTI